MTGIPADRAAAPLRRGRGRGDRLFHSGVTAAGTVVVLVLLATVVFIVIKAWPAVSHYGPGSFLSSDRWAPSDAVANQADPNPYGILQFLYGTLVTSAIAMVIAVPVSIAVALTITDVAPQRLRRPLSALVDLLAAIPSVVYGIWGIFALIPALRPFGDWAATAFDGIPVLGTVFSGPFSGVSYFSAGVVLAIMVLPIVTAVCREVFATAPCAEKESAYALGATRTEMLRMAVLPRSRSGIVGASVLGLGRALGETIAVTMLIGDNVLSITRSVLGQGATMPSVIANEFTEANQPFHLSSLFVVAGCLLALALVVNALGRLIVRRTGENIA
ncbi:phosphate ABC transporter permease subunit PstC [Streptomyces lacrimifluminis]|uniref:Phosphate transport system permease protein n=1 Tax=Streptomyces lacrimifluminis TaxID=1500077 RepID=A0A917KXW1_9ACTN|nr:phosphate ABC transporter permease subunit PstC [Streptomyces lacrimifluminis]GGJ32859.1 phosphate transport system permease protein [Streptomyces lacrimifluminis]